MDRSKDLHEAEVQALKDAEARGNKLLNQQSAMSDVCKELVEPFDAKCAATDETTKDLGRKEAAMTAKQQIGIDNVFADLEAKLQVSFAAHEKHNDKVQKQLAQTENMLKDAAANTGGARTCKAPEIRKEDCNIRKEDCNIRQLLRMLELNLETH